MANRRELLSAMCTLGAMSKLGFTRAWLSSEAEYQAAPKTAGNRPKTVAGIPLPDSELAVQATSLAESVSPPFLFNHAVRTYLFGSLVGKARRMRFDSELLYIACILHDIGLTDRFAGDLPFEIQGAEQAKKFLTEHGMPQERVAVIWDGIAMHALYIGYFKRPEICLVGEGAGADVVAPDEKEITKGEVKEVLASFPRLGFKTKFVDTCANIVRAHPRGAGSGFMRQIGERMVPTFHPSNICDLITRSPFEE